MSGRLRNHILLLILLFLSTGLFAQNREELEAQQKKLLEEIELTEKLLAQTQQNEQKSVNELSIIQKQIEYRQGLINNLNSQILLLDSQIDEITGVISSLENDLEKLKEEYAELVYHAYRNKTSLSTVMFLFSADNFNQLFMRLRYIRQLSEFRKNQAEFIESTTESLLEKLGNVEDKREEQKGLLTNLQSQKSNLLAEKNSKNEIISELQNKKLKLKKEINDKKKAAEDLKKVLEEIIANEMKKTSTDVVVLSSDFVKNKGSLPWPVSKGFISSTFGEHPHPVLTHVKTTNNGVDIKTEQDQQVKAVFDGTVTSVIFNPSFQKAVIVRHGDYFTVYSNLKDVVVKSGQNITTGTVLGKVYTNTKENTTELHLEVWEGTSKQDPALWIQKK